MEYLHWVAGFLVGAIVTILCVAKQISNDDKMLQYLKEQSLLRESELARAKERIKDSYYPKKESIAFVKWVRNDIHCVHKSDEDSWEAYQKSKVK